MRATSGKALRVLLIGMAVLGALFVAGLLALDRIAAAAVEEAGTYALGVETTLGSADLSLVEGKVRLKELSVANPTGFASPRFFGMQLCQVHVPPKALLEDRVIVEELVLDGIEISLERAGGRTNYGVILANLERLSSGEPKAADEGGKRFGFRRIVVRDVKARVDLVSPLPGQAIEIPGFTLENVGTSGGGLSMAEVLGRVILEVLQAAVAQAGDLIPAELKQELGKSLAGLGDFAEGAAAHFKKGLDAAGQGLGSGAKEFGKGIKKLFD